MREAHVSRSQKRSDARGSPAPQATDRREAMKQWRVQRRCERHRSRPCGASIAAQSARSADRDSRSRYRVPPAAPRSPYARNQTPKYARLICSRVSASLALRATRGPPESRRHAATRAAPSPRPARRSPRVMPSRVMRGHGVVDLAGSRSAPGPATARRTAARSGLLISARPIATICCWPPDSDVAGARRFSLEDREQRVQALQVPGPRRARRTRPSAGSPPR